MPRFTVLMPTHNRADVVGYAIRSVLAQSEPDFELFVVGDGCTDATADVVAAFADPRIRWFDLPKAPNYGYANRNVALREARGERIAFAAHDDLLLPDHLARMGEAMGPGIDWAYSRPLWVSTDGYVVPYGTNLHNADELRFFMEVGNTIPASCVVYRRDCHDRFSWWPEEIVRAADWQLWRRFVAGGGAQALAYVRAPTTLHFSADWKKSRDSLSGEVAMWLRIAEDASWWPQVLCHTVPGPLQEQRVIWEAMAQERDFTERLRAAIDDVTIRLAWDSIRVHLPRIDHLQHDLAEARVAAAITSVDETYGTALQAELEAARRSLADCHRELGAIRASRSWRFTAPLRRLLGALKGSRAG